MTEQMKTIGILAVLCILAGTAGILFLEKHPQTSGSEQSVAEIVETEEAAPTMAPPTETEPAGLSDWPLTLVNSTHPVPEGYVPELVTLSNGNQVDAKMYPDLQRMFDAARADGLELKVGEGYRTRADQEQMMSSRIQSHLDNGCSPEEAESLARAYVAEPGTSEHELGLAVDINGAGGTESWEVYQWLYQNAYHYGFIQRYPEGKTEITGIDYEPWHYRYVGLDVAEEINTSGRTLEEYLKE